VTSSTVLAGSIIGAMLLAGSAPATAQLGAVFEGSRWSIVEVYGEPLPQDDSPFIAFEDDGKFIGRTACNWFHGSYSAGTGSIVLLTRLTTLRGCIIGNKRRPDATLEALDSTASYSVMGSVLTLSDDSGEPVARLEKQADDTASGP
jgi:heat shock protein HslJ